jgi:O-succinylbenzoic acid--CoA ligase
MVSPAAVLDPIGTDWLAHRAAVSPQATALIFEDQAWSFSELSQQVDIFCSWLHAQSVGPHSKAALLMSNRFEAVLIVFALARVGAVLVALNRHLKADEIRYQLEAADCQLIFTEAEAGTEICDPELFPESQFQIFSFESSRHPHVRALDWAHAVGQAPAERQSDPTKVQSILFTSGTTGRPKGVPIQFQALFFSAIASVFRIGNEARDSWLACMPIYHIGGLAILFRACLYGIPVVMARRFETDQVDALLREHAVTLVSLVPTMLHRLLPIWESHGLPSDLRTILLGGAAADSALLARAMAAGAPIALTYGLTETCSQAVTATPDQVRKKPGSVGKPLMFYAVDIQDEKQAPLPAGQAGQIAISGPGLMPGYLPGTAPPTEGLATAQPELLNQDWFLTGDHGYLDEDGDLWVLARRHDLIVSGGENVYPAEVENVLKRWNGVQDACVVGRADREWGHIVVAVLVTAETLDMQALIRHCRDQLAGFKCPTEFRQASVLPRTPSGKLQRSKVAAGWNEFQVIAGKVNND